MVYFEDYSVLLLQEKHLCSDFNMKESQNTAVCVTKFHDSVESCLFVILC